MRSVTKIRPATEMIRQIIWRPGELETWECTEGGAGGGLEESGMEGSETEESGMEESGMEESGTEESGMDARLS